MAEGTLTYNEKTEAKTAESAVAMVNKLIDMATLDAKSHQSQMQKDLKWYHGKHWSNRLASHRAKVVYNKIYSTVESMFPILTDGTPRIVAKPLTKEAVQYIPSVNSFIDTLWWQLSVNRELDWWCKDGLLVGDGWFKTGYDFEAKRVNVGCIDPFILFRDPDATRLDDAEFMVFIKPVNVDLLRYRYPDQKANIKPDESIPDHFKNKRSDFTGDSVKIQAPIDRAAIYESKDSPDSPTQPNQTLLIECWKKDYTMEGGKLKYPGGRVITMAGRKTLLKDIPHPYPYLVQKMNHIYPLVRFSSTIIPHEFYQGSEVKQLIPLQQDINKRKSQITEILSLMGNPQWIKDFESKVIDDNLTNKPGLIIGKKKGTELRREQGQSPPVGTFEDLDRSSSQMDDVSGIHDLSKGRREPGVNSGIAIERIQEAAQTRLRKRIRQQEDGLGDLGRHILEHYRANFKGVTDVRTSESKAGEYKFTPFTPSKIEGEIGFGVEIESSYTMSRSNKFNKAIQLFDRKALDTLSLLEAAEWEDKDKVLKRLNLQRVAEAEAEQARQAEEQAQKGAQ